MRIHTAVAQMPLPDGSHYEPLSGILVDERASRLARGRGRGNLYVLVEVGGEQAGRDATALQLAETIRQAYFGASGSVTAGLQQAISRANHVLFEENRNALPGERRSAGITCAVLRHDNLFLAQAGSATAFLWQEGQLLRFPEQPRPEADLLPGEEPGVLVGSRREVDVSLYHIPVVGADTLLLVESEAAREVEGAAWSLILDSSSVTAVLESLADKVRHDNFWALAVRFNSAEADISAAPPLPDETSHAPVATGPTLGEQISAWWEQLRLGERAQAAGGALLAGLAALGRGILAFFRGLVPGQPTAPPSPGRAAKAPKRKAVAQPDAPSKAVGPSPAGQKALTAIAIAIPLIVALIVVGAYLQRGQGQRSELEALWQAADNDWQAAQVTSDKATVRSLLVEAEDSLDKLLVRQPDRAEAIELRKRVQARLDQLNSVRRITWLAELRTYPAGAELSRVVVEGAHVFVMDRRAGTVYHHQMDEYRQALKPDEGDPILVRKGDQVGNTVVGDLLDMTWMPAGTERQKANLLILESGGSLIEYDPATAERMALPLASTEHWQAPGLVGSYYGRFYLLDPAANQIWRYHPTPDGYSAPPDEWLTAQADLAGVVDMAIGNSIYLLYADGRLRKFSAGEPDTFDISDWDEPPNDPTALYTSPPEDTQWVYVADGGNSRIVQIGKDGRFRQQFRLSDDLPQDKGDPLSGVTSLFVDEISGHAYFSSGDKLYMVILPK